MTRPTLFDRQSAPQVDFDLHGLVGIRLLGCTMSDISTLRKQLGAVEAGLSRPPDITVRFVPNLAMNGLCHVDLNATGFDTENFFVFRSSNKEFRARIDFACIGRQCEIVCESGAPLVPLLTPITNLTFLAKGYVPLHGSGFIHEGTGVLVTGWSKGGKTEALLAFGAHGARYVGDEWVILSPDGSRMYGIAEHVRLWDWQLDNLPHLWRHVPRRVRWMFHGIHGLSRLERRVPHRVRETFAATLLRRAIPPLKRQLNVQLAPQLIFGDRTGPFAAAPEKLFLMISHTRPEIEVEAVDAMIVARRMAASLQYEQLPFWSRYLEFRFAFPRASNRFLESAHEMQTELLCRALAGKQAYTVRHPYPVSLSSLYEAMAPYVNTRAAAAS